MQQTTTENVSEITVRDEVNETTTARSSSKSISDSKQSKNAVSTTTRATTNQGGYAVGEASSETDGHVETTVTISPESKNVNNSKYLSKGLKSNPNASRNNVLFVLLYY